MGLQKLSQRNRRQPKNSDAILVLFSFFTLDTGTDAGYDRLQCNFFISNEFLNFETAWWQCNSKKEPQRLKFLFIKLLSGKQQNVSDIFLRSVGVVLSIYFFSIFFQVVSGSMLKVVSWTFKFWVCQDFFECVIESN